MKRILLVILAVCLMCGGSALAENDLRDVSGVLCENGRLTGAIVSPNVQTGRMEQALYVDCAFPDAFTAEQLVVITAELRELDHAAIGSAVRATGASWRDSQTETFGPGCASGRTAPLPSAAEPDAAREQAVVIAGDFLRACGLGESYVTRALRPEDEARMRAANLTESVREAALKRSLREWYTKELNYTWVSLLFTLRGLPVAPEWEDEANDVIQSSIANLYIGDGGEMREFILFNAPCELSAAPYTGEIKTPLAALGELSTQYGCNDPAPGVDERGRETPAMQPVAADIRPAYKSDDGKTFYPAWLITVRWQSLAGEASGIVTYAIDARVNK